MELTREQRDRIRAGGAPRLTFPGDEPCPLEPGTEIVIASNLSIRIERIRRTKKGEHIAFYTIRDFRVQLMRRVPPMHSPPDLDELGYPIPHDKEAIARARVEGAITSSPALAVPGDAGEVVPGEYQNVVRMSSRSKWAEHQATERAEQQMRDAARRVTAQIRDNLVTMARQGVDPDRVPGRRPACGPTPESGRRRMIPPLASGSIPLEPVPRPAIAVTKGHNADGVPTPQAGRSSTSEQPPPDQPVARKAPRDTHSPPKTRWCARPGACTS